jgi:hypothetical protein
MIDIAVLKNIDPELAKVSDIEALEIRDLLYRMAELALKNYYEDENVSKYPTGDSATCKQL